MLRAQYDNNSYTFYLTLKDAYSYGGSGVGFLFKFTNDMSGAVKWGYGQEVYNTDRYTRMKMFSTNGGTQPESVLYGVIDLEPNGYWKYEIYLTDYYPSPCGGIDPTKNGFWECTDTTVPPTVIDSGSLNVDVYEIKNLSADTYSISDYTSCQPTYNYNTFTQEIKKLSCPTYPPRQFYFTRVVRNANTNTFYIDSVAGVGSYIKIFSSSKTYIHTITSNPESIVINLDVNATYTFEHYDKFNVLIETYNTITTLQSLPNTWLFDGFAILCSNNEYEKDDCQKGMPYEGSIFFAFSKTGDMAGGEALEGPLELGKLYVEEQVGVEQVQYTERESPPSTNYIYND